MFGLPPSRIRIFCAFPTPRWCKAGADDAAVVDPQLRVRDVERLWVADCSIMPTLVSGNTNLPAIMIGEKASDLILAGEAAAMTTCSRGTGDLQVDLWIFAG
jgi:hypothetical protein